MGAVGDWQKALTVAGLAGVVVLFVPFAYATVPIRDVLPGGSFFDPLSPFWLLALPLIILPVPISLSLVLSLAGRLPAWANAAGYLLACASACSVLLACVIAPDADAPLALGLYGMAYAGSAWFIIKAARASSPAPGVVAMQAAYVVSTAVWVADFLSENADIGAYLALLTVIVYATQMALAVRRRIIFLAVLVPLTVLVVTAVLADS